MAEKHPIVSSPFGTAEWAHLVTPDTKFNELGEYKVNLIVPAEEAKAFKETLERHLEVFVADLRVQNEAKTGAAKKKEIKISEFLPWSENEDGSITFKFKRKAKVITDKGETYEFNVNLVDGRGAVIPHDRTKDLSIGNGSIIRCRAEAMCYHSPMQGAGISLRLIDAQIKKLVKYTGAGFDAIEGDDEVFEYSLGGDSGYTPADQPNVPAGYSV